MEDIKPKPKKPLDKEEDETGKRGGKSRGDKVEPLPTGLFSDSLNEYIVKAYQKCKGNEKDEATMSRLLKDEVQSAQKKGQLGRDWSKHPLPVLPVEVPKPSVIKIEKVWPRVKPRE